MAGNAWPANAQSPPRPGARRGLSGQTKTIVQDRLNKLHEELEAGLRTNQGYTVRGAADEARALRWEHVAFGDPAATPPVPASGNCVTPSSP